MQNGKYIFYQSLISNFPYETNKEQQEMFLAFVEFLYIENNNVLFLLKGYAGTGKTTLVSSIIKSFEKFGINTVLLAPTGRASKVLGNYANKKAFTIHKIIYRTIRDAHGNLSFQLKANTQKNTFFFVDESSMISDDSNESKINSTGSLLSDLLRFVVSGTKCKLVLIGDTAQLPPINFENSPALNTDYLQEVYKCEVIEKELTDVMRQHINSEILLNATQLRKVIAFENDSDFLFKIQNKEIIRLVDGYEIEDALVNSYQNYGFEDSIILVWSNKRANLYNKQIRSRILGREEIISKGDFLMVVKNNYYWLDEEEEAGFIANGDIIEVLVVKRIVELYGFTFAEVKIRLIDYPNMQPLETILLLETLESNTPSLPYKDLNRLYQEIALDYIHINSKLQLHKTVKENPFFNALQVKYAYAVTCHKAQGGQWKNVFVEKPYLPDGQHKEYFRWLYTALTRAQEKIFLLNYTDADFQK